MVVTPCSLAGARSRRHLPVEDIAAGDLVLACTHQGQFDLVLQGLDVKSTAFTSSTKRITDCLCQLLNALTLCGAQRYGAWAIRIPMCVIQKRLGKRVCDFRCVERYRLAVSANDHICTDNISFHTKTPTKMRVTQMIGRGLVKRPLSEIA